MISLCRLKIRGERHQWTTGNAARRDELMIRQCNLTRRTRWRAGGDGRGAVELLQSAVRQHATMVWCVLVSIT